MWAIYYPFSTSEVVSVYRGAGIEVDPTVAKRYLQCSIYSDARGDYLDGYHNLSDILDFHYLTHTEFFPNLDRVGLDELLDCIFILIEKHESNPMLSVRMMTEKRYHLLFAKDLFEFVILEKPHGLQIEGERGFSRSHAAELTLIYVIFLHNYYGTQICQHQTTPVGHLKGSYFTSH
jgi:hypothetical protein